MNTEELLKKIEELQSIIEQQKIIIDELKQKEQYWRRKYYVQSYTTL